MIADQPQLKPTSSLQSRTFERAGAAAALLGIFFSFFGLSWDIQWHADVGPDTFWTLPHLFVYTGSALTGLACLSVSLISTRLYRHDPDPAWISVLGGRFHAPLGFVVSGLGALGFLLFGFFDQWWHGRFGFDVTLDSPPHIGLLLSLVLTMCGTSLIFVSGREVRPLAYALSVSLCLGFALPVLTMLLSEMDLNFQYLIFPVVFFSLGMALVASVTRSPWWVLGMTLMFAAFRTLNWYSIPSLDRAYADALGYGVRESARGFAYIPFLSPMFAPLAGLVFAVVATVWQRLRRNAALGAALGAALAAPLLYAEGTIIKLGETPVMIPVVMLLGAAFGWVGWQLGVVIRRSVAADTADNTGPTDHTGSADDTGPAANPGTADRTDPRTDVAGQQA
jgi:hypothetical protein